MSESKQNDTLRAGEEASRVVAKKQKTCEGRVSSVLDDMVAHVKRAAAELRSNNKCAGHSEAVMSELKKKLDALLKDANAHTKELHSAINKFSKVCSMIRRHLRAISIFTHYLYHGATLRQSVPRVYCAGTLQAVDKFVDDKVDICKFTRDVDMDQAVLNQVCFVSICPWGALACLQ